jgi:hypothetical protein
MTTIIWLMLFKEIVAVYSENHAKHIKTVCVQNAELLTVKVSCTYKVPLCFRELIFSRLVLVYTSVHITEEILKPRSW